MKSFLFTKFLSTACGCVWMLSGVAQRVLPTYPLAVSDQETSNLVFPYRIIKTDLGSADLLGHQDPRLDRVLFLKAGRKQMAPTNLSVYTSDGKSYFFQVRYEATPDTLNVSFVDENKPGESNNEELQDAALDSLAVMVRSQPRLFHHSARIQTVQLTLEGIYVRDRTLWLKLTVRNESPFVYTPEQWQFSIGARHQPKRTAEQQRLLVPKWQEYPKAVLPGNRATVIVGLPLFTIPPGSQMLMQISEAEGARLLQLRVSGRLMNKTKHF